MPADEFIHSKRSKRRRTRHRERSLVNDHEHHGDYGQHRSEQRHHRCKPADIAEHHLPIGHAKFGHDLLLHGADSILIRQHFLRQLNCVNSGQLRTHHQHRELNADLPDLAGNLNRRPVFLRIMQRLDGPKLEREPQTAVGAIRFERQPRHQLHHQRHHITGPDQHFGPRVKRHRRQHLPGSGHRHVPRHGGVRFRLGFVLHRAVAPKLPDFGRKQNDLNQQCAFPHWHLLGPKPGPILKHRPGRHRLVDLPQQHHKFLVQIAERPGFSHHSGDREDL